MAELTLSARTPAPAVAETPRTRATAEAAAALPGHATAADRAGGGSLFRAWAAPPPGAVDRYTLYAGMLDLLAAAAEETPILAVADDAHLLDEASAQAIPFIARRLRIDGIALVIATESDDGFA